MTTVIQQTYCVLLLLLLYYILYDIKIICYVKTSNIVLDLVTKIIVHFCSDFTSRFLKQI